MTMRRAPCCDCVGLRRGPWTPEEDQKLSAYIQENGHGSWRTLPQKAGLQRSGKSCRLRWINYLRPDIKRGKFTAYEEQMMIQLHALLGNRWSVIAAHLPNRTDNEIKNYWNTCIKKKLAKMGIDPVTHKRKYTLCSSDKGMNMAVLDHIAQWESTRLEAEARLAKDSKLHLQNLNVLGSHCNEPSLASFGFRPSFHLLKAWQSGYGFGSAAVDHNGISKAPAYTLSFIKSAVAMLAPRPLRMLKTTLEASTPANLTRNNDLLGFHRDIEGDVELADVGMGNDYLPPCDMDEWNDNFCFQHFRNDGGKVQEENCLYDIFNNLEPLDSVVF